MQNLVVVSHTVCALMKAVPKIRERAGAHLLGLGVADAIGTHYYRTCVTIPNFAAPGQAVSA